MEDLGGRLDAGETAWEFPELDPLRLSRSRRNIVQLLQVRDHRDQAETLTTLAIFPDIST
jgi:hypothetical protein